MIIRSPSKVKWYRSITVKLALALGLAMFSIQLLASIVIVQRFQASFEDMDVVPRSASSPFAQYLSERLTVDEKGQWTPSPEALEVIEGFLEFGETYVWLDAQNRVIVAGEEILSHIDIGSTWPLCEQSEYCAVELGQGTLSAGSTWSKLAFGNRQHIGTFVLIWFESPELSALGQQRFQADLLARLVAAGLVATLTSLLLVSLVTRRLSKLAAEASTPLDGTAEVVDLPGPFEVPGDDEISKLAGALNTMRSRIEELMGRLAERDRQRREWIAHVSHDLRTPLTALTACLDRARNKLSLAANFTEKESLLDIVTVARLDADRVATMVDDLFELARLDTDETLTLEPVPPGELVRQTVRGFRPLADTQGIDLRTVIAPALPIIQADGRRLMRALENLMRNAVRFAKNEVEISAVCEGDDLKFAVRDDGPGLPEVDGKVVLGQTDGQPRHPDSTGLGLIVTGRVATAHGGTIGGANAPDGGAVVWIRIPVVVRR